MDSGPSAGVSLLGAMLTLAGKQQIGSFTVFRDVDLSDGRRALTSTFYALPDEPRLARDASGGLAFRYVRYRSLNDDKHTGGLATVTIELGCSADEKEDLTKAIAEKLSLDVQAVRVQSLPVDSGT